MNERHPHNNSGSEEEPNQHEHPSHEAEQQFGYAFAAWAEVNGGTPERFNDFIEAYLGHYGSVQDFAIRLAGDLGYMAELARLPESLLQDLVCFDTEALAQDMVQDGDVYPIASPDGGVWIFKGNA